MVWLIFILKLHRFTFDAVITDFHSDSSVIRFKLKSAYFSIEFVGWFWRICLYKSALNYFLSKCFRCCNDQFSKVVSLNFRGKKTSRWHMHTFFCMCDVSIDGASIGTNVCQASWQQKLLTTFFYHSFNSHNLHLSMFGCRFFFSFTSLFSQSTKSRNWCCIHLLN